MMSELLYGFVSQACMHKRPRILLWQTAYHSIGTCSKFVCLLFAPSSGRPILQKHMLAYVSTHESPGWQCKSCLAHHPAGHHCRQHLNSRSATHMLQANKPASALAQGHFFFTAITGRYAAHLQHRRSHTILTRPHNHTWSWPCVITHDPDKTITYYTWLWQDHIINKAEATATR